MPLAELLPQRVLPMVRDHQPDQQFASPEDEAAAREIVRELGGFTLAVEQVASYLGLHLSVTPRALLASLREKGVTRTDELARKLQAEGREGEILHQHQQLGLILDATLAMLQSSRHAPRDEASRDQTSIDTSASRDHKAHLAERDGYVSPALTAVQFAALLPPPIVCRGRGCRRSPPRSIRN